MVGKVTEATVEVVSEDADGAGSLRAPLRLDVVASEATHKKLMLVSNPGPHAGLACSWGRRRCVWGGKGLCS